MDEQNKIDEQKKEKKKKNKDVVVIMLIIIIILLILLLMRCSNNTESVVTGNEVSGLDIAEDNPWDGTMKPSSGTALTDTIDIPGYSSLYVAEDSKCIRLVNPENNTVYLQYAIYECDALIYESQAITPGNMIEADFYSILTQGEHNLTFKISSYDIETQSQCNGATQSVLLVVK